MNLLATLGLFVVTALAEIVGCYLPWLWLWGVDQVRPDRWDLLGRAVAIAGMAIILFGPRA